MFSGIKKQHVIVFLLMLSLLFGAGVTYGKYLARKALPPVAVSSPAPADAAKAGKAAEPATVVVHVTGAVRNPGVFSLKEGSRVLDAVQMAVPDGEADLNGLNLAKKLADQEKITVPSRAALSGESSGLKAPAGPAAASESGPGQLININTAQGTELETLPGIGPAKAEAIIQYREENGYFSSIEDIQNVSGIGPATFNKLKDRITI